MKINKVKVISEGRHECLENNINVFLEENPDIEIIDMKFQDNPNCPLVVIIHYKIENIDRFSNGR